MGFDFGMAFGGESMGMNDGVSRLLLLEGAQNNCPNGFETSKVHHRSGKEQQSNQSMRTWASAVYVHSISLYLRDLTPQIVKCPMSVSDT